MTSSSLTFDHQTKSKTCASGNRIWLASDEENNLNDDPGSPPLEGGEALCELLIDTR